MFSYCNTIRSQGERCLVQILLIYAEILGNTSSWFKFVLMYTKKQLEISGFMLTLPKIVLFFKNL